MAESTGEGKAERMANYNASRSNQRSSRGTMKALSSRNNGSDTPF